MATPLINSALKSEAAELFAQVSGDGLESAISTIEKGFGGEWFYPNYVFLGQTYNKRKLVLAVIKAWVKESNPQNLDDLLTGFP